MSDINRRNEYRAFSLMFPAEQLSDSQGTETELSPDAWRDLGLDNIVSAFTQKRDYQKEIAKVFCKLLQAPEVIQYRQEIIQDLLDNPPLVKRLSELLPVIDSLDNYSFRISEEMNSIHELAWRMGELQNIVDCVQGLSNIFRDLHGRITSTGLKSLEKEIQEIDQSPLFQNLVQMLPDMLSKARTCASVTIGVNLDAGMRPVQATLLSIHDEFFTGQSLLNKLFGLHKDMEGIGPIHSVPPRYVDGQVALPIPVDLGLSVTPVMVPLFSDLSRILEKTSKPIVEQLKQYAELQGSLFVNLRCNLIFYLGAVTMVQKLREAGLPVCRPEILPAADRICEVIDSYNANLALHQAEFVDKPDLTEAIVRNGIRMGSEGRILILTGPNQGGKTTYLQGVGLAQVLAQVGCFIPGSEARMSLVDQIFTHFPIEEKPDLEMGRLGEEATRMEKIFQQVTGSSLVLLNEALASTSSVESLYLAEDIVKMMRMVGARAIYSTHLHELANRADEMNAAVPGNSRITSIVSSPVSLDAAAPVVELRRTFKIEARPPLGQSFAHEIAAHYGISFEQLHKMLKNRGVI